MAGEELPAALDRALRARYMPREVRSPITTARGLNARLNQMEKALTRDGDRKGAATRRIAAELGVTPRTIQRWRTGERTPNGPSRRRIEAQHNRLVTLPQTRKRLRNLPPPNEVHVSARVIWAGYENRTPYRTVKLHGMRTVMARTIRVWASAGPEAAADAFQRGTATVHNVANTPDEAGVLFKDDVTIDFP